MPNSVAGQHCIEQVVNGKGLCFPSHSTNQGLETDCPVVFLLGLNQAVAKQAQLRKDGTVLFSDPMRERASKVNAS